MSRDADTPAPHDQLRGTRAHGLSGAELPPHHLRPGQARGKSAHRSRQISVTTLALRVSPLESHPCGHAPLQLHAQQEGICHRGAGGGVGAEGPADAITRKVINGISFRIRTGLSWRNRTSWYGSWKTVSGATARSSRRNRRYLRSRRIKHTPGAEGPAVDPPAQGKRGGRPAGFDTETYKRRSEAERTIGRLKHSRAVATPYDKRAYAFTALSPSPRYASGSGLDQPASSTSARFTRSAATSSQSGPCSHRLSAASRISAGSSGRCKSTRR